MDDKQLTPDPAEFRFKVLLVALGFIVLGVILYFVVSAVVGGIIALIGAVFAVGDQVYRNLPKE